MYSWRHSFSAPAQLSLTLISDRLHKVQSLTGRATKLSDWAYHDRVGQVSQLVLPRAGHLELGHRSKSTGDLFHPILSSKSCVEKLLDKIMNITVMEKSPDNGLLKTVTKPRICHQCHGPLDQPVHEGVPCGV